MTDSDSPVASSGPTAPQGVRPAKISNEPLINAVHRWGPEIAFLICVLGMVYMSFVPFDLQRTPTRAGDAAALLGLPVAAFNMPDILANIGVYFPLGGCAMLVARRRGLRPFTAGVAALVPIGVMSYAVEFGQQYVASRVSSSVDLTANVLGALLGIVFAGLWEAPIHRMIRRARRSFRHDQWSVMSKAFVCAVLVVALRPYDIVVDPIHTAYGLRHAEVGPLARWSGLEQEVEQAVATGRRVGMHELPRVQWEYVLDRCVDVVIYAAVTLLMALSLSTRFRSRVRLLLSAGFVTLSLACLITLIRIFLISRGLDTAHWVCAVVGWMVGGAVALPLVGRGLSLSRPDVAREESAKSGMPAAWTLAACCGAIAVVMLYELVPFDFRAGALSDGDGYGSVIWIPLYGHFHSRPNDAVFDVSGKLLRYGCMAACLATLLRCFSNRPWQVRLWLTILATAIAATGFQFVHLASPSRFTDVTTVLLAICAAAAGAIGAQWLTDYRASLAGRVVYDHLTSRLVEGDSFDKESAIRPPSRRSGASPTDSVESRQPN